MCNSGFYRIPGSNICFSLSVFLSLHHRFTDSFFRKSLLFCVFLFFSLPFLHNPSLPFIMEFLVFSGNRWFPCFTLLQTEHALYPSLGKSHFRFFSFFPSFSSDFFESSWLAIFFGMCWGMPFSTSPILAFFSTFPFSFPSGRNPVLPTWKPLVIILFFVLPCSSSLRLFLSVPWEVAGFYWRSRSFCYCFLFSSSVFFFRAVLVFLCLCAWKDPRLLMVPEDPCFLSLAVVLFFLDASLSGLQDPLGLCFIPSWVSCICYFGLSLIFPFGLDLFFWASFTMILFRPQHRVHGLGRTLTPLRKTKKTFILIFNNNN